MIQHLEQEAVTSMPQDELPIEDFETIEFYVGNAKQAAYFYNKLFGFDIVAYRGPETGCRETCSYVLQQNHITFQVTSALVPDHPVSRHVIRHGDGVKDIGLKVADVEAVYREAVRRGAQSIMPPTVLEDKDGLVKKATIAAYGETTHTFIQRSHRVHEPGFVDRKLYARSCGLFRVDHIVANVEKGRMEDWVAFYQDIFGFFVFRHYDEKDISTQYSALVSKVMSNRSGSVKMPINEPAEGVRKSQIQEYIDYYGSAGVQHVAISTHDILHTVESLRNQGVELMTVPSTYYENLTQRVGTILEPVSELADLGILVDRDEGGYLLQIFTQPLQDRPTFFFEIIQRQGADGFGKGNFKALFEAIEREQARRGNL